MQTINTEETEEERRELTTAIELLRRGWTLHRVETPERVTLSLVKTESNPVCINVIREDVSDMTFVRLLMMDKLKLHITVGTKVTVYVYKE